MADTIKVNTAELEKDGSLFTDISSNFEKESKAIFFALADLENHWEGSFAEDLSSQTKEILTQLKTVSDRISMFGLFMVKAASEYIDYDTNGKQLVDRLLYPDTVEVSVHAPLNSNPIGYSDKDKVEAGKIRRILQHDGNDNSYKAWGIENEKWAWGDVPSTVGCAVASTSMALSWLGKDLKPQDIVKNNGGYPPFGDMKWESQGFKVDILSSDSIEEALKNFQNDPQNYAPPIIKVDSVRTGYHFVLLIGKDQSGKYIVQDPLKLDTKTYSGSIYYLRQYHL